MKSLRKNTLNRVGLTYQELTVLEHVGKNKHRQNLWKCLCSCGNHKIIPSGELGRTKSCGCLRKGTNKNSKHPNHAVGPNSPYWKGHGLISAYRWKKMKDSASKRNINFDITIEEAWNLFQQQEGFCALSGLEIRMGVKAREYGTASLDRIDSNLGYTKDNIQWVHKNINTMKMDLPQQEFILLCEKIYKNHLTNTDKHDTL
jgi:hypothetical protein